MNRYLISPAAQEDLRQIRDYLAERGSRKVAARVLIELRDAINRLVEMPEMGHVRRDLLYEYYMARDVRSILDSPNS